MIPIERMSYRPFVIAGVFWGMIGGIVAVFYFSQGSLITFSKLFLVGVFNLYFLGKTITRLVTYLQSRTSADVLGIFLWGNAKLLTLVLIGMIAYRNQDQVLAVFLGCTTLVWVPLVGGLLWSKTKWITDLVGFIIFTVSQPTSLA